MRSLEIIETQFKNKLKEMKIKLANDKCRKIQRIKKK
jgi:hypothetical protein